MLARSKLNSIESKISKTLMNNDIDMKKKYRELKQSIRMMNSQRRDSEKNNFIEEGKKSINDINDNGINEVIKRNKIINNSLKP